MLAAATKYLRKKMFQSMRQPSGNYALGGVRVIDLSQFGAGAMCAQFLAWLGADVVKVEAPTGDHARYSANDTQGVDSFEFILSNANKRSVVCDLESERGKDDLSKVAWYWDTTEEKTMAVGTKAPNTWGIHDLLGNVADIDVLPRLISGFRLFPGQGQQLLD